MLLVLGARYASSRCSASRSTIPMGSGYSERGVATPEPAWRWLRRMRGGAGEKTSKQQRRGTMPACPADGLGISHMADSSKE